MRSNERHEILMTNVSLGAGAHVSKRQETMCGVVGKHGHKASAEPVCVAELGAKAAPHQVGLNGQPLSAQQSGQTEGVRLP